MAVSGSSEEALVSARFHVSRLEFHRQRWGTLRHGEAEWTLKPALLPERDDLFVRQANAFLDALEGRAPVLCSLDEAAHTLRVNLAALRSGTDRRPVAIDQVDDT